MKNIVIALMMLATSAHAEWTTIPSTPLPEGADDPAVEPKIDIVKIIKVNPPTEQNWKDQAKAAVESATLDYQFRTMAIMSNMPDWLRKPYPYGKRRRFKNRAAD
jgi:hypothetical protein